MFYQNLNSFFVEDSDCQKKKNSVHVKCKVLCGPNGPPYTAVCASIFFQPNKSCSLCMFCGQNFFTGQHNTLTKNYDVYYNASFNMKRPPIFWALIHAVVCFNGSWSGCERCNMHCSDIIRYCGGSAYLQKVLSAGHNSGTDQQTTWHGKKES